MVNTDIMKIIGFWLLCAWGVTCSRIIKSYHESKPLGFQTLFGKVIVIFMDSFALWSIHYASLFSYSISRFGKDNWIPTVILTVLALINFVALQLSMLLVLLTKYLSIYQSSYIFSLNEQRILRGLKLFILLAAMLLTMIDFGYWTEMKKTAIFQILYDYQNFTSQQVETTKSFLAATIVVSIFALQLRLEYDNYRHGENQSCCLHLLFKLLCWKRIASTGGNNNTTHTEYKVGFLRIVALVMIFFGARMLYHRFDGNADVTGSLTLAYSAFNVLIPSAFIFYHQGLNRHCQSKMLLIVNACMFR